MAADDFPHLAREVRSRRTNDLELSQRELAKKAGLSFSTIQAIEAGQPRKMHEQTARALERGLDWEPESVHDTLRGGRPRPVLRSPLTDTQAIAAAIEDLPDEVRQEVFARIDRIPDVRAMRGAVGALEEMAAIQELVRRARRRLNDDNGTEGRAI